MKKIIILTCLALATAFSSMAQDNTMSSERANRLTNQMIRDLQLNNYQASRMRAINQEKINKIMEIERKYAANPELLDKNYKAICKQRDKEVESFLSNDQYCEYYASRNQYQKSDRNFAAQIGLNNRVADRKNQASAILGEPVIQTKAKPEPVLKPASVEED